MGGCLQQVADASIRRVEAFAHHGLQDGVRFSRSKGSLSATRSENTNRAGDGNATAAAAIARGAIIRGHRAATCLRAGNTRRFARREGAQQIVIFVPFDG